MLEDVECLSTIYTLSDIYTMLADFKHVLLFLIVVVVWLSAREVAFVVKVVRIWWRMLNTYLRLSIAHLIHCC